MGTRLESLPTPKEYPELLDAILLLQRANRSSSLGVGIPGLIAKDGRVEIATNVPCLSGMNVGSDISKIIEKPVFQANHLVCFAVSELHGGSASKTGCTVCLVFGTGIGATLIFDGQIFTGANRMAGEIGSSPLIGLEPTRSIEDVLSGASIPLDVRTGVNVSEHEVWMDRCSRFFQNICYFYDPASIVLLGGIASSHGFLGRIHSSLQSDMLRAPSATSISYSRFGESSGVRGVALLTSSSETVAKLISQGIVFRFGPQVAR